MTQLIANLILNTVIFLLGCRWLLKPKLAQLNASVVLAGILLLHSMRHPGLMFLAAGTVLTGMPRQFAVPAAADDFLAATLAITAATFIQRKKLSLGN
jgi:hypothetical protein